MKDVTEIKKLNGGFLDSGSPHFIKMVDNLVSLNVNDEEKRIEIQLF